MGKRKDINMAYIAGKTNGIRFRGIRIIRPCRFLILGKLPDRAVIKED
jgi:hypothetical protein